jgi:deoxyribonuclease V
MRVSRLHRWDVTPREAVHIQEDLRTRVIRSGRLANVRLIAGADTAFDTQSNAAFAAVVVLSFPGLTIIEKRVVRSKVTFPYVPGLLSFREALPLLRAFTQLRHEPDLVFIDGHGFAHPRRAGIACHLGLLLNRPVIGCAKSLLTGTYHDLGKARGSTAPLTDASGEVLGTVLRTRDKIKPVFVSVGHKIRLANAVRWPAHPPIGFRSQPGLLTSRRKRLSGIF